jgi:hypothetical protein
MRLLLDPISSGKGAGRPFKLEERPRLRGGIGSSVGLSKNDEVLDACGLGTVACPSISDFRLTGAKSSFFNRGSVDEDAIGATLGESEGGNGGGGPSGFGGRTSVVQDALNKSLRDVESERGLVVVVAVIFVCVFVLIFEVDIRTWFIV